MKHDFEGMAGCPALFDLRGNRGRRSEFGKLLKGVRPKRLTLKRPGPVDLAQFTAIITPER